MSKVKSWLLTILFISGVLLLICFSTLVQGYLPELNTPIPQYEPKAEYITEYAFNDWPRPIQLPMWPEYTYVRVSTNGIAEGRIPELYGGIKWKTQRGSYHLDGVGFVISENYIVTAAHVVEPFATCFWQSKHSVFCTRITKVITRQIYVGTGIDTGTAYEDNIPVSLHYLDIEHDIALLHIEGFPLEPAPYPIVNNIWPCNSCNSEHLGGLQAGDAVATIVRVRNENDEWDTLNTFEVRYGTVLSPTITGIESTHIITWFNPLDITVDIVIYPGDSGSPLFAFRAGKPVLVGMLRAGKTTKPGEPRFSYAVRIDFLDRFLNKKVW